MSNLTQKKNRSKNKNGDKETCYRVMNNAAYGKTSNNLRGRIDVRVVSNKNDKKTI